MEKEIPWKKKPGQAILMSEQSRLQNIEYYRDKKELLIQIKGLIHQKDIPILNVYVLKASNTHIKD